MPNMPDKPDMITVPATAAIDLHLHTIYSDGHWTPQELFAYLATQQFRVVSITDHDTVTHCDQLRLLGQAHNVTVLSGVEVTSRWRGMIAHVLCYAEQFTGTALATLVDATRHGSQKTPRPYMLSWNGEAIVFHSATRSLLPRKENCSGRSTMHAYS